MTQGLFRWIRSIARRARQRKAARAYGAFLRTRTSEELERERRLIESSNDIALRDAEW